MGRGRAPCCDKTKVRTGPWSPEEDLRLMNFIQKHGHSNWRALPKQAGLLRCGKSCRLRWINYLRPDVKRGNFTPEEENTIIQLHNSIGNKWSKIASCLPGRTDNEIKNVWNTHLKKRSVVKKKRDEDEDNCLNMKDSSTTTTTTEKQAVSHSPSSSCVSNNSDSPKEALAQEAGDDDVTTSDFDVDFWQVLDSLEPLEPTKGDDGAGGANLVEEVEIGKWLRILENELGLATDGDCLPEPQILVDLSATHHCLGI